MVGEVSERVVLGRMPRPTTEIVYRTASGVVLATVAVLANWAGSIPFAAMVCIIGVAMSWEWGRIVRGTAWDRTMLAHGTAVVGAIVLAAAGLAVWALALLALAAIGVAFGRLVVNSDRHLVMSAAGVLYVGLPSVALVWLRDADAAGSLALLFVFAVVWTTDTFAYLCGSMIGGPRIWPALSPRKTWAGTIGGIVFAGAIALAFAWTSGSQAAIVLLSTALLLSAATQLGDLLESAIKRRYQIEQASSLIPGHGGFMDRMDGIAAAAVVAALIGLARNAAAPAAALLAGS
jgi:phosphatidate cytidylyltransferase